MTNLENMITYDDKNEENEEAKIENLNDIQNQEQVKEDNNDENNIKTLNDLILPSEVNNLNNNDENNINEDNNLNIELNNNYENNVNDDNNLNIELNNNYESNNINGENNNENYDENNLNNINNNIDDNNKNLLDKDNIDFNHENINNNEDLNFNNNIYEANQINNNINENENNDIQGANIINKQNIDTNDTNQNTNNKDIKKENKVEEKDIIDELIEKVRANQIIIDKKSYKETLNKLDEELALGLEKLNEIDTNKKSFLDTQKELKNQNYSKNKKFNDLLSEINKTIKERDNKYYINGTYMDYKNLKIINPRVYFQSEKKRPTKRFIKNRNNGFYLSSIDGKIIVNGERKDNFNNNYFEKTFNKSLNNFYQIKNNDTMNNFYLSRRNNYSIDRMRKSEINIYNIPEYRTRRINRFTKDYFQGELEKIENLLFSNKYSLDSKIY